MGLVDKYERDKEKFFRRVCCNNGFIVETKIIAAKYFGEHNKVVEDWIELPLGWKERLQVFNRLNNNPKWQVVPSTAGNTVGPENVLCPCKSISILFND